MIDRVPSPHTTSPEPRDDESADAWTDRLAREGAALGVRRQCSIGWHGECSARDDGPAAECRCACHGEEPAPPLWAGTDRHEEQRIEAWAYGERVELEVPGCSLLALDRADAAGLGAALTAWAAES